MNISAYLGVAGLTGVGYRFYTATETAVAARVTAGITDAGDGWYSADVTIPATTASVRWDSTVTPAAVAREYFIHEQVWGKTMANHQRPAITAGPCGAQWVFILSRNKITQTATFRRCATTPIARRSRRLRSPTITTLRETSSPKDGCPAAKSFTQAVLATLARSRQFRRISIGDLVVCVAWSQFTAQRPSSPAPHLHGDSGAFPNDGSLRRQRAACGVCGGHRHVPYVIARYGRSGCNFDHNRCNTTRLLHGRRAARPIPATSLPIRLPLPALPVTCWFWKLLLGT